MASVCGASGCVDEDDGLAAALVQPGRRRPCSVIASREAQDVAQRVVLAGVVPEPDPAERRTERGRVDGDDRPEARGGVGDEDDLLVASLGHQIADGLTPVCHAQTLVRRPMCAPDPCTRVPLSG